MKFLISIVFALIFSSAARADFVIEPWLGYELGTFDYPGNIKGDSTGANFGARLGFKTLGFAVGGEYSYSGLTDKPSSGSSVSQKATDLGVFASFNFPILLRVYATYFVSSKATVGSYTGTFEGNGYRVGVGFTGLPFVVLNVEVISRDYNKSNGTSITGGDFKNNTVGLNVSLPLP